MAINFVAASNQRIDLGSGMTALQNVTGGTLMAWAKITSFVNTNDFIAHITINTSNASGRLSLATVLAGTLTRAGARRLDADAVSNVDKSASQATGVWFHIAAVAEYNNAILRLYVNGVQNNTLAIAGWTGATSNTTSNTSAIGCAGSGSTTSDFNGDIEDVRIYNRALSANEILSIYTLRGKDANFTNRVRRWAMNENAATVVPGTVYDQQRVTDGSQVGSPTYVATGNLGRRRRAA